MSKKKAPKKSATHVILPGSNRPKDPATVRVRGVDPNEQIDLTINLRGPKLPSPDDYVGQTMTPDQLSKCESCSSPGRVDRVASFQEPAPM